MTATLNISPDLSLPLEAVTETFAILAALIAAYPHGVPKDDLSESTGYKRSSRDTYLQRLRARQLVTTDGDPRAADVLFDGGAVRR